MRPGTGTSSGADGVPRSSTPAPEPRVDTDVPEGTSTVVGTSVGDPVVSPEVPGTSVTLGMEGERIPEQNFEGFFLSRENGTRESPPWSTCFR